MFSLKSCVTAVTVIGIAWPVQAATLVEVIEQKMQQPILKQQAIADGRERALLCSVCHGEDGNSKKPDVPNLAGQNPVYLLDQIHKFADGRRKNYVMNSLAKSFSSDDIINLSIFYTSMPVRPARVDAKLASAGKALYDKQCFTCHGEHGLGTSSFARVAGQQAEYVTTTLKQFRQSAEPNAGTAPAESKRSSPVMEPIAKNLSDADIAALAAYVSQLE